jgi:hypothetical protein
MSWHVDGTRVKFDGGPPALFEHPIRELTEVGEVAVVVLEVPLDAVMTENVFGVSRDGERLWQIEWIPETGTNPRNTYVGVTFAEPEKGLVHVADRNGTVVDVDVRTGRIVGHQWLR